MKEPATAKASSWLQRGVALGVGVRTARIGRRLEEPQRALRQQGRIWQDLVVRQAATDFGRLVGLERGLRYVEFRRRVAPRTYEDFAPWIERMTRGEADVLWPGRCAYFAVSSGTTAGRTKHLPITPAMLAHFRQAGLDSLCYYSHRVGRSTVFLGRHLFLGGATTLAPIPDARPLAAWSGDLSGITAAHLPRWVERQLYEPGREIAQMEDWTEKLRAMAARTATRNITLLAGIPSWLLILAGELQMRTGRFPLNEVWPRLECLVHGGVPVGPFAAQLRAAVGPSVNFHEVYPASEGFIAAQDDEPAAGLRLMSEAGIFYEFLPFSQFDESRRDQLADAVVPLAEVETGIDYALLLTTPAGLTRYVIGDVVRFVSTTPPRLLYVGRTRLQLSAFGEHVIEKELTDALAAACTSLGVTVANFHVAPRFVPSEDSAQRARHEWWIEFATAPGPAELAQFADRLDVELQGRNADYQGKRIGRGLDTPVVQSVPAGTFERWLRSRGKWGGQNKMPRCRSDREVADELARFAGGSG